MDNYKRIKKGMSYQEVEEILGAGTLNEVDDSTSKYINTKETKIFKKGELIYNYHNAKDMARKMDEVIVVEGTLYPLLTRQKNAGLLSYRWEESQQGPPRKYYELTEEGRTYLTDLDNSWKELVESVNLIRTR